MQPGSKGGKPASSGDPATRRALAIRRASKAVRLVLVPHCASVIWGESQRKKRFEEEGSDLTVKTQRIGHVRCDRPRFGPARRRLVVACLVNG